MKFRTILENKYSSNLLLEALNDSQKALVDQWPKHDGSNNDYMFGDKDRLTFPLDAGEHQHPNIPDPEVNAHLEKHGFKIKDYRAGIATSPDGRDMRIGRLLNRGKTAHPGLLKTFNEDATRNTTKAGKSGLSVTISRRPHDVAAMSTGQGWTSCMDMEGGCNSHYLKNDIEVGTAVAYLHKSDDHDLQHPLARMALKPHGSYSIPSSEYSETALLPEDVHYGTNNGAFSNFVHSFAREKGRLDPNQPYHMHGDLYNDTESPYMHHIPPSKLLVGDIQQRVHAAKHYPEHAGKLINDPDEWVRSEVAKHPEHAGKLINDPERIVREQVAKHPEYAGKLINDPNEYVRREVAKHPEHAGKLINDPDKHVRMEVAKYPEHAGKLINDPHEYVRGAVAKHSEHAGKLINDPDKLVRREVAKHPEHAGKLINDPNEYVRGEVAKHPEHAGKLINDPNNYVKYEAAKHSEHAGRMINDPDAAVRMVVAGYPEHAGKMINDPDAAVKYEVAKHSEHAGKMINDPDAAVRMVVANHPEHAGKMINDPDRYVRQEVAKHSEHAGKMINDPDKLVRREVAKHSEHAGKMINDPDEWVKYEVAKHPEHAGKMINDPDEWVADTAKQTLGRDTRMGQWYDEQH